MVMVKTKVGSLNEILGTRSRAVFPYRINFDTIGYEQLPKMKQWCEDNCKSIWRCEHFHALYFQFENDYDATMFMLKWGTKEGNKLK
jgi:hypothetical protein